ncbi:MAG TPA: acyltransferase [Marmoricola sp.]|nr:acyltransferase [Marmoricola sp.]HNO40026.1 acyltransferase [Marmoricola sp.]
MSKTNSTQLHESAPHTGTYFPALDTTRAIGAIAVLGTHAAFMSGAYLRHGIWGSLLAHLDVGVAIFFVLSGFLLSRQWLVKRVQGNPLPPVPDYFWKRFLRIYPVYLVGILPALLWVGQDVDLWPTRWLTNLLMVDLYFFSPLPHGMTQMWSLATEVAFYLFLPVLIWILVGRRSSSTGQGNPVLNPIRMSLVLGGLVIINLAWFPAIRQIELSPGAPNLSQWLPAYLSWFAVGVALAWAQLVATHPTGPLPGPVRWLQHWAAAPWSCLFAAGSLLLFSSTPITGPIFLSLPTVGEQITKTLSYALIGALVVLPGVFLQKSGFYQQAMTARIPRHIGLISYGVFCIHLPILSLIYWATPYQMFTGHGWEVFFIALALSLVAAELIHRLVELPSNRLRNLFARPSQKTAESIRVSD